MNTNDPTPPVADDDFPEFAEPPRHVPPHAREPKESAQRAKTDERQGEVDSMIERLRRERAEGKR